MDELNHFKFSPSTWIIPTGFLVFIWMIFYLDNSFHLHLSVHGIYPRTFSGLQGIFFSPFLHGNLSHIANNSLPLFILTLALIYFYRAVSLKVLFYGIIISGLLTWIIGRPNIHIGASGLIYVLVSFIFFKGLLTKYYRLMALSFAVILLYGGMIWYVFPDVDSTISWEGHLAGLITGVSFALFIKTPDYKKEIRYDWEKTDFNPQDDPFMKRFDENGNFVNTPEDKEISDEIAPLPIQYIYEFKEDFEVDKEKNY
ncbi:MAG: rhomboid family intramembrane serine protease [Flavobacterium sp.]|nr:rhomboid family intramembrane serine protease [Flavobacterium sp.]